jgi:hypothetical protein
MILSTDHVSTPSTIVGAGSAFDFFEEPPPCRFWTLPPGVRQRTAMSREMSNQAESDKSMLHVV